MTAEALSLSHDADRALAAGDRANAISLLEQAVLAAPDFSTWMKLAALRRASGTFEPALEAVNAALAFQPIDFMALLSRAMLLERLGAGNCNEAFHQALAQRPAEGIPPGMQAMVAHAQARAAEFIEARDAALRQALMPALAQASAEERSRIDRFRSNALRQSRVYHSEPTHYHFPGLFEREFHDRRDFPWLEAFEQATGEIAAEFQALAQSERGELVPYLRYAGHEPVGTLRALNNSRDWTAIHLWEDGRMVEANAAHCPRTLALLHEVGQPRVAGMSPSAMFSLLAPNTHIPPHTGVTNTRLVCHLPLIVPPGCWFRGGAETRFWETGKAFIFDDTIEHEAMNPSGELRVVLIFDLWHPGLSACEKSAVGAVMEDRAKPAIADRPSRD